jgi:hypothetical protein
VSAAQKALHSDTVVPIRFSRACGWH